MSAAPETVAQPKYTIVSTPNGERVYRCDNCMGFEMYVSVIPNGSCLGLKCAHCDNPEQEMTW